MTLRRLPASFRSFLLLSQGFLLCVAQTSLADESISEAVPRGVNVDNEDEPKVDLPESTESPFLQIKRTRRKKTNDPLVELCKETVQVTSRRMLSTDLHTPWQMIHALLGVRNKFSLLHNGKAISGLDWIARGQTYENEYWFERTRHGGRAHPYSRPYAFEGHANQTIALISMCGVELDREFGVADGSVTMRDMIRHAQMTVTQKDEPTWTLWVLSRYLPPTARWRAENGQYWSIERLVQEQVAKPMRGAPCGGTHGLFALAHARNVYLQQGQSLRGVWLQAEYKIRKYINTARMQQNSNGSLSSNYFRGREFNPDFNKRMASVGHVLEFLMIALPQNELNSQWVRRAVHSAATELMNNRKAHVKCSPLYHTVNALNIYLDRVNPPEPGDIAAKEGRKTVQAEAPKTSKVPTKTVSQPKVIVDEPKVEKVETPAAPVHKPESIDITPNEDFQPKLKVADTTPKPVVETGEWKATAKERQGDITVPETKTGGAKPSTDPEFKHEKPATPADTQAMPTAEMPKPMSTEPDTLTVPGTGTESERPLVPQPAEELRVPTEKQPPSKPAAVVSVTDSALGLSADRTQTLSPVPSAATTAEASLSAKATSEFAAGFPSATESRNAIVAALGIQAGMSVAEVGSGSGQFVKPIADAVGNKGQLFAIENSAELVEQLETMVEQNELTNVHVVRNDDESLQLMTRRVDVVLLSDAYYDLKKPTSIVRSIHRTLKPGGEFVVVESQGLNQAQRNAMVDSIVQTGFEWVSDVNAPGLKSGTYLRFRRPF